MEVVDNTKPRIVVGWAPLIDGYVIPNIKPYCFFCKRRATRHAYFAPDPKFVAQIRCCNKRGCQKKALKLAEVAS